MSKKRAFILLELFLYLGLLSIFVCGMMSFAVTSYLYFQKLTKESEEVVRNTVVLSLIKRDLMNVSCSPRDIIVSDNLSFIKNSCSSAGIVRTERIEWSVVETGLNRSFGSYDPLTKKWISKHSTLCVCSIKKLWFKVQTEQNRITRIDVLYAIGHTKEVCMSVMVRNRVLL
ncbi:MAG: hypothetical protein V1855_01120 [bacterium]